MITFSENQQKIVDALEAVNHMNNDKNNDLIKRVIELENELNLMKEQLDRLCGCLYPQALGKDDLEYIATGKQKGGAE